MNTIPNHRIPSSLQGAGLLVITAFLAAPALALQGSNPPAPAPQGGTPVVKPATDAPTIKPAGGDATKTAADAAAKQREKQVLLEAFRGLEEELKASLPEFSKTISELSKAGIPREQWPLSPAATFYPRFEALAQQDQPDALRWCIGAMSSTGLSMDEQISRKDALYKRYVTACLDSQWTPDIVTFLKNDAVPTGIGLDRVLPLLDEIAGRAPFNEYRSSALWTKQELCTKSTNPEHKVMARKALETLSASFPNTKEGRDAKGLLFRQDKLQVGMPAPEVNTVDEFGNAFKLSDFKGKVTVIAFWGIWCAPCRAQIPMERELVARYKDKPFAILGVNTDSKKDEYMKFVVDNGITWKNSWQGSTTGPWCTAWGIQRFPTYFVLDAQGVIRFTNQGGGQPVGNAVDHLMSELESGGKSPAPGDKPAPTPPAPGNTPPAPK